MASGKKTEKASDIIKRLIRENQVFMDHDTRPDPRRLTKAYNHILELVEWYESEAEKE